MSNTVSPIPIKKDKSEYKGPNSEADRQGNFFVIAHGVPQGSILGSFLFLITKNKNKQYLCFKKIIYIV